jgi:hypothetical protein
MNADPTERLKRSLEQQAQTDDGRSRTDLPGREWRAAVVRVRGSHGHTLAHATPQDVLDPGRVRIGAGHRRRPHIQATK